MVQSHL